MMDHRPVWAMPSWVPEALRDALPSDWELVVIDEPTDGSGDGAARVSPGVLAAVREAEIYLGYGNSAGIHAPPMAETVLGMLLFFARGIDHAVASQRKGRWSTDSFYDAPVPPFELSRATVGIVGFGGIGREVARRVASLGARVIAVKRTPPGAGEANLKPVSGEGELGSRIELVHGERGLDAVLRESDLVVLAAPDTPETRGSIDAAALARMRPGAVLVNVARGSLVDEEALLDALRSGRLRGAGLDVFSREPLPEGHPLWSFDQVLVTPHVSAVTPGFWRRETDLILRNLERHLTGAPLSEWENVVDKTAGY
jgi:phosphoglycerate dehydrogenase-like enzyme